MPPTADEHVLLESRRHGIVLFAPLVRAVALASAGGASLLTGWPFSLAAPVLIGVAALVALRSVWRWEATRVIVTRERLLVSTGILRRHQAAVGLSRVGSFEVEQSLLGRVLGYGTLIAGDLEVSYVSQPRELCRMVERL
jgi:membrane protein YdbS with pleckstrin-like domain